MILHKLEVDQNDIGFFAKIQRLLNVVHHVNHEHLVMIDCLGRLIDTLGLRHP